MLSNNVIIMTTVLKMCTYYITVIRRILTLEYICSSTSVSPSLETGYLSTRIISVIKIHTCVQIVCSIVNATYVRTPIHMFA